MEMNLGQLPKKAFSKLMTRIKAFDQTALGLDKDFSLISYAALKG